MTVWWSFGLLNGNFLAQYVGGGGEGEQGMTSCFLGQAPHAASIPLLITVYFYTTIQYSLRSLLLGPYSPEVSFIILIFHCKKDKK
jgi:hypothetical protein